MTLRQELSFRLGSEDDGLLFYGTKTENRRTQESIPNEDHRDSDIREIDSLWVGSKNNLEGLLFTNDLSRGIIHDRQLVYGIKRIVRHEGGTLKSIQKGEEGKG